MDKPEELLTKEMIIKAKADIISFELAVYVAHLEEQAWQFKKQVMDAQAEMSMQKDHIMGLDQIMQGRTRDRRLAQVLCDWMNLHQDKKDGWKVCLCDLCRETKNHMNALGDPIIHTGRGWECTEDREDFKNRNVAQEFCDNAVLIGEPIHETEGVPVDDYPPKRGSRETKEK